LTWKSLRPRYSIVPSDLPARQVARAVQARAGRGAERVGDEAFGGELVAMQVAARDLRAAHVQLAGHPDGHGWPPASSR
jgi:hypothetical protein